MSSTVDISCNIDGSFVGVGQVRGSADTITSAPLAASYQNISDGGLPDPLTTSDLDAYRRKPGKGDVNIYTRSLPGQYASLLYTAVTRHGVLLEKGFDLFGVPLFSKSRNLNLTGNGHWTKTKSGTSMTDEEIIAMFSPYAEASGSAQNNAGQGISNQVPSVSADTNMEADDDDDGNSDTQTNNYLLIAGAFVLVAIVLAVNQEPSEPVRVSEPLEPRRVRLTTSPVFDAEALKKTIIENNLFRPLGWTRRVPAPAYRLTGTIIRRNSKVPPQALILLTVDQKTHIVTLGDKLAANTTVIEIRSKHVILDRGGQRITLKLDTSLWLSTSRGRFSRPR